MRGWPTEDGFGQHTCVVGARLAHGLSMKVAIGLAFMGFVYQWYILSSCWQLCSHKEQTTVVVPEANDDPADYKRRHSVYW